MTPLKLAIYALAASSVAKSGVVTREPAGSTSFQVIKIAQSDEVSQTTQNQASSPWCDIPDPPDRVKMLFNQKQMLDDRITHGVNQLVKHLEDIFDETKLRDNTFNHDWWSGYTKEETLKISQLGYAKFGLTYGKLLEIEIKERAFKERVGNFVVCEVDEENGDRTSKRILVSYKMNGKYINAQVKCQKGETRLYLIPEGATGISAVNMDKPINYHNKVPFVMEHFFKTMNHTPQETHAYFNDLFNKLEQSKDSQGLSKLAERVINSVDRTNDSTNLHRRATQALNAAQNIIEENRTAREWFRISKAAQSRRNEL